MADTKLRHQQLQLDNTPTTGSLNPVTSGGVYSYVETAVSGLQLPQHYKGQVTYAAETAGAVDMVTAAQDDTCLVLSTNTVLTYTGSVWSSTPLGTPQTGDYFYVLNLLDIDGGLPEGSVTWNGTTWDVAPDHYYQPDRETIGLNANGQLEVRDSGVSFDKLDPVLGTLINGKQSVIDKVATIGENPDERTYPTTRAVKTYVDNAISSAVSAVVPSINQYDLTNQLDGTKVTFDIDSSITSSSFVLAHYAG
jgi:hypothetical protein